MRILRENLVDAHSYFSCHESLAKLKFHASGLKSPYLPAVGIAGWTSGGIGFLYGVSSSVSCSFALALTASEGFSSTSAAVLAIILAAANMTRCAKPLLPRATVCHECPGVPKTKQAVVICAVGTTQLTSPTSVEPESSIEERAVGSFPSTSAE